MPDASDAAAHECQLQKLKPSVIKGCLFTHSHSWRNNIISDPLLKEGHCHLLTETLGMGMGRSVWYPVQGKACLLKRRGQQQSAARPPRSKVQCYCSILENVTLPFHFSHLEICGDWWKAFSQVDGCIWGGTKHTPQQFLFFFFKLQIKCKCQNKKWGSARQAGADGLGSAGSLRKGHCDIWQII